MNICPLCQSPDIYPFYQDNYRCYLRCQCCALVFVPKHQHLATADEKAIYDLHENTLTDRGYEAFLARMVDSLTPLLEPASKGLDYGCGPAPLLATLLTQSGHHMRTYDLFYHNEPSVLAERFQFITCTEVVEHFRDPQLEFARLFGLLSNEGILAVMTKRVIDADAFSRWHYKNDPTHISFFSESTFHWLAYQYRCQVNFVAKDIAIFKT